VAVKCPKCHFENPDDTLFCGKCGTQFPSPERIEVTETLETPKEELIRGTTLANRYEIIEELGKGGMGRVYRVEDTKLNQEVALKLIKPEIAKDKKTIERFRNELKLARNIRHKNVCGMFDLGEIEGAHFITMEYVRGEDLKSFIHRSGQLTIGTAIRISKQICDGLAEAHRLGVVHRDLKSNNIMIDKDGNVRIMDFGIARSLESKGITGAGVMIGTPEYMSPEQVEGKEVDQRSDIYSLGIILYEMVTGRVPFEGETPFTIGVKHKSEIARDPRELNTQIPQDLGRLVLKCLEKAKEKRYQNDAELHADLEKVEQGLPTTERVVAKQKPFTSREITVKFSLKKALVPALIVAGAAVIALALWRLWPRKEPAAAPKIKNSIAVISFENQTGDQSYNYLQKAIPNLLITSLEQRGVGYVATWERLRDLLKQMGKGDLEIIDADVGFELCRREGIQAIVLGSFVKAGEVFATDVKVLDVGTKKLLMSAGSRGKGVDSILENQIDQLTADISQGIALTTNTIPSGQVRVADVTTSSMEAYNYFLRGKEEYEKFYYESAQRFLEKAVELDPMFATAYLCLSDTFAGLNDGRAQREAIERAKEYSNKATEKERLYIEAVYVLYTKEDSAAYANLIEQLTRKYPKEKEFHLELAGSLETKDLPKAIEEYAKALELDPQYGVALNSLAIIYRGTEDYEKSLELFRRYAAVSPGDANPFDSMAWTYLRMGDLDRARAKFEEALEVKPDFYYSLKGLIYLWALKQDYPEAMRWAGQFISRIQSPGLRIEGLRCRALLQFWQGQIEGALKTLREADELAEKIPSKGNLVFGDFMRGCIRFERGESELARKYLQSCWDYEMRTYPLSRQVNKIIYAYELGLLEIQLGLIDSARSRSTDIKANLTKLGDNFTWDVSLYDELLSAEILLREGKTKAAIDLLVKMPQQRPPVAFGGGLFPVGYAFPSLKDILARAYQQNGETDKAIAEYERLVTFGPQNISRALIHPLNYYRLAKLYEQKGDKAKAGENYRRFLDLWKDADSGLPEVEIARKKLAGLRG
jgi:serine/threonine protein kinase/Tfp pilus assembly protein PilF